MNPRIAAITWGLLVMAAQVMIPLTVRDRLPDPLATHWGPAGAADGHMSFGAYLTMVALLWGVPWAAALGMALYGGTLSRRQGRMFWWGLLGGMGLFALGVNAVTVLANLDAPVWSAARPAGWSVGAAIAVALAGALLAGRLGRGAPDEPAPPARRPPLLRLRAGQRSVWVSRVTSPWPILLALLGAAALVVLGALYLVGLLPGEVLVAGGPALAAVLVAGLVTSSVSVRAGDDGVVIQFGPLGWPARRIPLSKISSAWPEELVPSQVGGWGIRGLPGGATIMLRGGECLVLGYRTGGRLAISIDDAERGASLINALIAERVEQ